MTEFLQWLGPVECYDPSDPVYAEDYLKKHSAPPQGSVLQLHVGCDELSSRVVMVNAATWSIPSIGVSQEGYAHGGFVGTIGELLEKLKRDVDMMRGGYGEETQELINAFLGRVDEILDGNDTTGSNACHITITDPSGISCVLLYQEDGTVVTDRCDENNGIGWVTRHSFTRSFTDNDELGLVPKIYSKVDPSVQSKTAKEIADMVMKSNRVVCVTGAGISVESGIPPFRSRGQYTTEDNKNDPKTPSSHSDASADTIWGSFDASRMTVHGFNSDIEVAKSWWEMKHNYLPKFHAAAPNPAHNFFYKLQERGQLRKVITQNIDSLHQRAGVHADNMLEVHGHMRGLICSDNASTPYNPLPRHTGNCTYSLSDEDAHAVKYHAGNPLPHCPLCNHPLRTETVMFEQPLPEGCLTTAIESTGDADLLFVIGTSLVVRPVNNLPEIALRQGVPVVMINLDDTQYDAYATAVIREPAGKFLADVMKHMEHA